MSVEIHTNGQTTRGCVWGAAQILARDHGWERKPELADLLEDLFQRHRPELSRRRDGRQGIDFERLAEIALEAGEPASQGALW